MGLLNSLDAILCFDTSLRQQIPGTLARFLVHRESAESTLVLALTPELFLHDKEEWECYTELMTPHEALAEGRLADAIAIQRAAVIADSSDPGARRLLVDLLAFAGRHDEALDQLASIISADPAWPRVQHRLERLLRADSIRLKRRARAYPQPSPRHMIGRRRATRALRAGRPGHAVRYVDAADAAAPHIRGFLDGQEFDGLRDADDRFASILEAFHRGRYLWFAWESLRKIELRPAAVLLDQLYRPATLTLKDGPLVPVCLPLVYPESHHADDAFALGMETDYLCPDGGPTRCIGAKLLLVGDGAEVPLAACRMIEVAF